jgi:DNA-binding NarL/FixJ family response regulator
MFRIFLVEDDERASAAIIDLLSDLDGMSVVACTASESDAVGWLMHNQLNWDLAIVDLALGAGSGLRVLSACRVRQPHQKMVVLSNQLTGQMRRRCKTLGADYVFDKASDIEALLAYCRNAAKRLG